MNVRRLSPQEQAEYQSHAVTVDAQRNMGLRVQRGERKFVPPAKVQQIQLPLMAPTAGTDLSQAISTVSGTSHDASTAKDRAVGYVIRFGAMAAVILVLAFTVALVFVWTASHVGAQPGWFDRVIVFFAALAGGLLFTGWKMNVLDYLYSGMGVERKRLDTLQEMHRTQLEHDLETRRMALAATLQLMDRRGDYGDDID